jgi:hypothetical protein
LPANDLFRLAVFSECYLFLIECYGFAAKRFFLRIFLQNQRPPELAGRDFEYDIACMTALTVHNFHWLYEGEKDIIDAMTKDKIHGLKCCNRQQCLFTWLWQLQHPTTA